MKLKDFIAEAKTSSKGQIFLLKQKLKEKLSTEERKKVEAKLKKLLAINDREVDKSLQKIVKERK